MKTEREDREGSEGVLVRVEIVLCHSEGIGRGSDARK